MSTLAEIEMAADVLSPEQKQEYVALSTRGYKETTLARRVVALRMFLRWLHTTRQMEEDRTALIELPKQWQRLPKTLNLDRTAELVRLRARHDRRVTLLRHEKNQGVGAAMVTGVAFLIGSAPFLSNMEPL